MSSRRRALLVASTGGHLEQINRLEAALLPHFERVDYATFDDAHSRSLLTGRRVHHVGHIPPRGGREALRAQAPALRILRSGGYTDVLSTGSAIAVPFLTAARLLGRRGHYIESAARSEGPSLSGRLASRLPGVHLYTQYPAWAEDRWQYRGSVFDRYGLSPEPRGTDRVSRVVVTLGTMRRYPFRRAVDAVRRCLREVASGDTDVLWQVGDTPVDDLPITANRLVPAAELSAAIREADLVIAHAGIGSCLQILDSGRAPVLLPRRAGMGEHIDDHQRMIAFELDRRELAVSCDPEMLGVEELQAAMRRHVVAEPEPAPFRLQGHGGAAWAPEETAVCTPDSAGGEGGSRESDGTTRETVTV